jgi:FkbM family methyltransferase
LVEPAQYLGWAIAMHGTHEPENTSLLLASFDSGDVFADVGANFGWFSLLAATHLRAIGGRAVAFEPQEGLAGLLRRSADLNQLDNLSVVCAAVGDRPGRTPLYQPNGAHPEYASLAWEGLPSGMVELVTLDAHFGDGGPTILKIDVEGYELRVLRGARKLLAAHPPRLILMEVHPPLMARAGDRCRELVDVLRSAGYRICYSPMSLRGRGRPQLVELEEAHLKRTCLNLVATLEGRG